MADAPGKTDPFGKLSGDEVARLIAAAEAVDDDGCCLRADLGEPHPQLARVFLAALVLTAAPACRLASADAPGKTDPFPSAPKEQRASVRPR